ncbi:phosphate regulon sensor histidine kinase PhoR [Martelella alba]|uniref:histidine kinase n=1 Tax=Martelella alba TaxID=2590451 RepID=A0A506U4R4_9HYPH|nr:phosphate regulon sensor histidine kinase PhoR [Martelella alba]TPW27539.1 phosphate regulon sensor histidine kinase PhoR [Martelella alba]
MLVADTLLAGGAFAIAVDPVAIGIGWLFLAGAALFAAGDHPPSAVHAPVAPPENETGNEADLGAVTPFLDEIDLGIYVLSANGSVLFQNRSASTTFGAVPAGAHISARMRAPGVLDIVRDTLTSGRSNQMEYSERLPSERVYLVRSVPVSGLNHAEETSLFLLMFRDISEARRIDRMRSDFVANASHELRTPLASLRGYIETLQGPAKGDAKAQERFLPIMLDQATRMSRLVDDLLSLSRLEVRAHLPPDKVVELGPLLEHVRDALLPLARELEVEIVLDLPDEPVSVNGDHDELVEVFENLVENGCKYGAEGGQVDVVLRVIKPRGAEVSVIDHGPGIPAEHVPRLTERFYRVSVADSRSKKGTGLGLAIVKHILTRHRARLVVRSEVGKGTEFTVRF